MNQQPRFAPIPFVDVAAQRRRLGARIDEAIARVLAHCQFIMGPEVVALEEQLAAFCGARHALGCASGTDALLLALMANDIGPGDAVICPAFTFCASAEAVVLVGATPVFADVDAATFNLDPAGLEASLAAARRAGRNPDDIELMAVTKTVNAERIREAYDAGIRLFGENRVQEFEAKVPALRDLNGARFHMIGHLQRNKAARAATLFHSVESVDSWRLASSLNEHVAERGIALPV